MLVCQLCRGELHDTGRTMKGAPMYDCLDCRRVFRWYRGEWRLVEGFDPIESRAAAGA